MALMMTVMLAAAGVAALPAASANDCRFFPDPHMCHVGDYPFCLVETAPLEWWGCRATAYFDNLLPVIYPPGEGRPVYDLVNWGICVAFFLPGTPPIHWDDVIEACSWPTGP